MEQENNNNGNGEVKLDSTKVGITKSEISLWLDNYGDLFSDFDPRPYSNRSLSQDFLDELRRATRNIEAGEFHVKLLAPTALRKPADEVVIRKRLKDHFKKHFLVVKKEHQKLIRKGIILAVLGFLFMLGATFVGHYGKETLLVTFLTVILEPGGWFMMWYGMDQIFYFGKEKKPEYEFYEKMDKADIKFDSY
jgi:hypothetical protein